jgi:hypothetical protein
MRATPLILMLYAVTLASCQSQSPTRPPSSPPAQRETDVHGCKTTQGWAWCERLFQCVNPRDLAIQKGFFPSREAFENYCSTHSPGVER